MVEGPVGPQHGVVAKFASRWEARRDVIHGGQRVVVIRLVATHAGRGGDVVIAVDMAIGALSRRHCVRSRQGKTGSRVIEDSIGPQHRVMTLFASLREAGLHVIGIGRSLIVLQVAAHARRSRDVVVAVDVAIRALPWRHRMRTA